MNYITLLFITIFSILLTTNNVLAATWYVDMQNGADTNAGNTVGAPWKHSPGQSTSPARTIASGDLVLFKRGVIHYIDSEISVISGVTYGAYGTGDAPIIDGGNTILAGFREAAKSTNVTIQNLTVRNIGGWSETDTILNGILVSSINLTTDVVTTSTAHGLTVGTNIGVTYDDWAANFITGARTSSSNYYVIEVTSSTSVKVSSTLGGASLDFTTTLPGTFKLFRPITSPPSGTAISFGSGGDNVLLENLNIYEIGQWIPLAPASGDQSISGTGIFLQNNNGVTIRNCSMDKLRTGIAIKSNLSGPIENILVENSSISHVVWGIDVAPRAANSVLSNITIKGTSISGTAVYDSGNWQGFGEKPHTDGMFLRASGMTSTWTNILIDGCRFYDDLTANSAGGTANIYISQGASAKVVNCVFVKSPQSNAALQSSYAKLAGMTQVLEFYNNTFISSAKCLVVSTGSNPDVLKVKNNIFWRSTTSNNANVVVVDPAAFTSPRIIEMDYNIYWNDNAAPINTNIFNLNNSSSYRTWAQWRTAFTNIDANSVVANPLFTSITGDPSTWNVAQTTGSPAIRTGINLTSSLTTDYTGATRPSTGAWDIGAFITGTAPTVDTTPPTVTSTSINSTGLILTVNFSESVQNVFAENYTMSGQIIETPTITGTAVTFPISPGVKSGEVKTLSYTSGAGRTRDASNNLLQSINNLSITNNSSVVPTNSTRPGKRRSAVGGSGVIR